MGEMRGQGIRDIEMHDGTGGDEQRTNGMRERDEERNERGEEFRNDFLD